MHNARLRELRQCATEHIRNYLATLNQHAPKLNAQATKLWDLCRRQRLVAGVNDGAAAALLVACQDAYSPICETIEQLKDIVKELVSVVAEYEQKQPTCMEENLWLADTLSVLHTHLKYLELQSDKLQPLLADDTSVHQFKQELQLVEASISMGLAQAERQFKLSG
ncbi:uncharacterized protein LOC108606948 [Drosophila busckii]|nr:uncharacterized protein LOC108606948 [Drosophila busckii]